MLPWTYGTCISGQNSSNAIEMAGLNWTVEKKPLFVQDGEFVELNNDCAIYRPDTKKHLGLCGRVYNPIQNVRAFEFMDEVSECLNYEYGGSINGGERIYLCASIPKANFSIGRHIHKAYINLLNPHSGKETIKVYPVDTRGSVVFTLSDGIKIKHSAKTEDRLNEGLKVIQNTMNIFEKYGEKLRKLNEVSMSLIEFKGVCEYVSGLHHGFEKDEYEITRLEYEQYKNGKLKNRRSSHIDTVASMIRFFKLEDPTAYGAFMGIVAWANSQRYNGTESKKAETKLSHLIFGKMRKIQSDAMGYIVKKYT